MYVCLLFCCCIPAGTVRFEKSTKNEYQPFLPVYASDARFLATEPMRFISRESYHGRSLYPFAFSGTCAAAFAATFAATSAATFSAVHAFDTAKIEVRRGERKFLTVPGRYGMYVGTTVTAGCIAHPGGLRENCERVAREFCERIARENPVLDTLGHSRAYKYAATVRQQHMHTSTLSSTASTYRNLCFLFARFSSSLLLTQNNY